MAMSFVQGGSGFSFFAPYVYSYYCIGDVVKVDLQTDDITNIEVRDLAQKVTYKKTLKNWFVFN